MVGKLLSFWEGPSSGSMLVSGRAPLSQKTTSRWFKENFGKIPWKLRQTVVWCPEKLSRFFFLVQLGFWGKSPRGCSFLHLKVLGQSSGAERDHHLGVFRRIEGTKHCTAMLQWVSFVLLNIALQKLPFQTKSVHIYKYIYIYRYIDYIYIYICKSLIYEILIYVSLLYMAYHLPTIIPLGL